MTVLEYPVTLEDGDEGAVVATFRDVPEAITEGDTRDEALANAIEALGLALITYPRRCLALPKPSLPETGETLVPVDAATAAKVAVLDAFRRADITKAELARRLGVDEKEVRRILDPLHTTKIATLANALSAMGRRLVVSIEDAAA